MSEQKELVAKRRYFVRCYQCRLIHIHGWAHHCPKAPDLTIKHPALAAPPIPKGEHEK